MQAEKTPDVLAITGLSGISHLCAHTIRG